VKGGEKEDVGGRLTSCVYPPRLRRNIGYAIVSLDSAGLGTPFTLLSPDGARRAKVVEKPFLGPEKRLARE
jgi:aminomethyltransferase